MNIIEKTDAELLEIANPMWGDLIKYSNEENYGAFTRHFSAALLLGANLSSDSVFLGIIRRGEYVTVLYKQKNTKLDGEWLGRLVLGYEADKVKIFGATIF